MSKFLTEEFLAEMEERHERALRWAERIDATLTQEQIDECIDGTWKPGGENRSSKKDDSRDRIELRKELWKLGYGPDAQEDLLAMLDRGEERRFNEIVESTSEHLENCARRHRPPYYHKKTNQPVTLAEARKHNPRDLMTNRPNQFNIGRRSTDDRDAEQFSLAKMLRDGMEGRSLSGIEAEMVDEGREEARASGIGLSGFMVSKQAFATREELRGGSYETRAGELSVTGGTNGDAGGVLVATKKIGLLARLTDAMVCVRAGATVFPNLTSRLDFPRITDASAISGKSEIATADKTTATFDTLELSPNRLPTYMEVSRQLLMQNDEQALNTFLQRHLEAKLLEKMERAFFNGGGTNEASGILQTSGIGSVALGTNGGAIDHASISKLIRAVGVANADQNGRFIFNSEVADKLRTTPKLASTDSKTLLDDARPGVLLGKGYFESNAVPNDLTKGDGTGLSAMIFGDFADLYIAQWSGVEFLVDPLTRANEGIVIIHANIFYDAGVIRPASFAAITDAITT